MAGFNFYGGVVRTQRPACLVDATPSYICRPLRLGMAVLIN